MIGRTELCVVAEEQCRRLLWLLTDFLNSWIILLGLCDTVRLLQSIIFQAHHTFQLKLINSVNVYIFRSTCGAIHLSVFLNGSLFRLLLVVTLKTMKM